MSRVILFVICLCLAYSNAQTPFTYQDPKPDYAAGKQIIPNTPDISAEGGTFSISPPLSKGLSLDPITGIISGSPEEQYQAKYVVIFIKPGGPIMMANLDITIWELPTRITCGIVSLVISKSQTDSFTCKSEKNVKSWSISFSPSGSYPISISDDGLLKLDELPPPENPITVTINAVNPAGKSETPTSIIISKSAKETKIGLITTINHVNDFSCDDENAINTVLNSKTTTIDNLDGLDGSDAYSAWDSKLGGFLSSNEVYYWNYSMESTIFTTQDGSYSFHRNSDYARYKIYIDGENKIMEHGTSYYDYDDYNYYTTECSIWDYSHKYESVMLKSGYHSFKIVGHYAKKQEICYEDDWDYEQYCNDITDATYKFLLKWKEPGETEEKSIPFYQSFVPYDIVYLLTFDSQYFTMPVNSIFEIPFKVERGNPAECTTGDDKIIVDLSKNVLKGQINEESNLHISVQCSTETSTTNTVVLNIDIIDKYVKGIVTYYLKSNEFDTTCSVPYTPSSDSVKTELIRLEDEINQEYNPSQSIWDGLTPNFASEFGVNWEGYLKIQSTGNYTFNLTSVQGSWLSIDYIELINHKYIHDWSSKTGTIYLTEGYHFMRVNYMKNVGGSGIQVLYKNEADSEFRNLKGNLYFVPRSDFEYRVSYAVYIVDKLISNNIPFIHGDKAIKNCVSNPSLPSGLEFYEECTIRGTPTTVQDEKSYVISGKLSDDSIVSSTILITVIGDVKPQGIHLVDSEGISVTTLNASIGEESHFVINIDSGFVVYYELPVLPGGFSYDKYTGSMTVFASEYLNNYQLEIRAYYSNTEYVSTKISTNVVSKCTGDTKPHFVKVVDPISPRTSSIDIEFQYPNRTTIKEYRIPKGDTPLYSTVFCLIPGDYKFYAHDNAWGDGTFFFEFYTDGKIADRVEMERMAYVTFEINTVIKTPIIDFSKFTKEEFYLNEKVDIIPTVKLLDNCEITPELPSFLQFNKTNCGITGTVTGEYPKTLYRIIGSNPNGVTTKSFNFTFYGETISKACMKQGNTLITIHINGSTSINPEYWSVYIYKTSDMENENKSAVISLIGSDEVWEHDNSYDYDYCIANDEYTAQYRTSYTAGYGKGFIDIIVNGIVVDRTSLNSKVKLLEKSFHSTPDYNYDTLWEYSIQYEDGWDDPNTQHTTTWSKSKLSEINPVSENVIYIRKIDTFTNTYDYTGCALTVSYISGIMIKVNGKEIFRNNLPNGEITPSTMANNIYNYLTDEVFILPITWLEEDPIEISIELHKFSGENNFPQIGASLLRIIGSKEDCLIVNKYSARATETNTVAPVFYVAYGFDENPNSRWLAREKPGWGIMRFKDHFHAYFNQFSIYVNILNSGPTDFSVEGYYNSEWIPIASFTNITYPESKKRVFTNYTTSVMYCAIKFTVIKTVLSSNSMDVNDINFHLCPLRYCKAVGSIPETITGTEINIGCETSGNEGNRTFLCNNDKTWIEIENTCNESPSIIAQENEYTFIAGSFYENIRLFTISGKEVFYSMVTEMGGLRIDNSTGLISGQPYTELSKKPVYFKARNPRGEIAIEIAITIIPSNKPITIWSNDSVVLDAGNNYRDYRLFYVTGQNIEYKVDKLPNGLNIDKSSGLISGITIKETSMTCIFTASNSVDYVDIVVEINVVLPIKPNNIRYEKEMNVIFGMDYNDLQPYICVAKTIKYSVEPELPDGLKLDKNSGLISGKVNVEPPSSKSYKFKCFNNDGEIENPITINIEESVEPVIISHVDSITIEGGKEYDEIILGRVTGKNLVYSIIPNLPSSTLKFDSSKGTISGYISSSFNPINTTILVSRNGKQVSYTLMLISLILDVPVVIPSTKISSITFKVGEAIKSTFLFKAVGTNIQITVTPDLPKGMTLDSKSGEIYGSPTEYVEKTIYNFTIRNPPSNEIQTVEVEIEFDAIYCESDSGFPRTPAEKGGKEVSIKCGGSKSGMKSRKCLLTDDNKSVWSIIDESDCKMSSGTIAGIAIGSIAAGLIVIVIIAFCLLRTGMFRKRARSLSVLRKVPISEKQNEEGVRV